MKNITDALRDDILEQLKEEAFKQKEKSSVPTTVSCGFRIDEPYNPQRPWNPDTSKLTDLIDQVATGVESVAAREFSMQYEGAVADPQEKRLKNTVVSSYLFLVKHKCST